MVIKETVLDEYDIPRYVVAMDKKETKYFLYKVNKDGSCTQTKEGDNPLFKELEKF